jgi:DNA replication protein DnaC
MGKMAPKLDLEVWKQRKSDRLDRSNQIAKRLKESSLPHEKTIANFDQKRLPVKVGHQLKVLLDGSFLDRKENLLLFGNPGAGKSYLLCALAHELIAQGRRMKYTSCAMLVQDRIPPSKPILFEGCSS